MEGEYLPSFLAVVASAAASLPDPAERAQWAGRGVHHILGVSGHFYGLIMGSSR